MQAPDVFENRSFLPLLECKRKFLDESWTKGSKSSSQKMEETACSKISLATTMFRFGLQHFQSLVQAGSTADGGPGTFSCSFPL
mmetsp:Transcript_20394/g.46279  ORF Transcript_20394/g.46279 Transcript_20394/m.46279 type:complete len:84 (-) Transcript_20394:693-944(-)